MKQSHLVEIEKKPECYVEKHVWLKPRSTKVKGIVIKYDRLLLVTKYHFGIAFTTGWYYMKKKLVAVY